MKAVLVTFGDNRLPKRFWSKVMKQDNGCWIWIGCKVRGGYGRFAMTQKIRNKMAHRISYEDLIGEIKTNLELDHLYRNPSCVNPNHLEQVTSRENTLRSPIARAALNARKVRCLNGHLFNKKNTYYVNNRNIRMCRVCAKLRMRKIRKGLELCQD